MSTKGIPCGTHRKHGLYSPVFILILCILPLPIQASQADENRQHEMSGMIGGGVAWTQKAGTTVGSLATTGSFRLLFDLQMPKRYLWGVDLDWMRIRSRNDQAIPHRLDAEGLGLVGAVRQSPLTLWGKVGGGRMFSRRGEWERNDAARYAYYQTAIGANLALYQTRFVWLELIASLGWLKTGSRWDASLGPGELGLASLQLSIKLFDL